MVKSQLFKLRNSIFSESYLTKLATAITMSIILATHDGNSWRRRFMKIHHIHVVLAVLLLGWGLTRYVVHT